MRAPFNFLIRTALRVLAAAAPKKYLASHDQNVDLHSNIDLGLGEVFAMRNRPKPVAFRIVKLLVNFAKQKKPLSAKKRPFLRIVL